MNPQVTIKEVDLSTRVPSFPGVYCGCLLPNAKKGPLTPYLCTSESQFLSQFTPNQRVEIGYDLAYYSILAALQQSNKVWVRRISNGALYGGEVIQKCDSSLANAYLGTGIADPESYTFTAPDDNSFLISQSNPGAWGGTGSGDGISIKIYNYKTVEQLVPGDIDITDNIITVDQDWSTGSEVLLTVSGSGSVLPAGIEANTGYYTIRQSATSVKLASTLANAQANVPIDITDVGTGNFNMSLVTVKCKEPEAFLLEVYQTYLGITSLVESWTCSKISGKVDGYGQNIYIEDILEGSNFIRAIDNIAVLDTYPKEQFITALMLNGGTDGNAVTDSDLLLALDDFSNIDNIPLTIMMDGGWATPAYQIQGINSLCSTRMDCIGLLSVPYSKEASEYYINEIVDYRKNQLNISSSFTALFTSHVSIYDKFNNRSIYVSPDGYIAAIISKTAANYELWYPPAGFRRGMIDVLDVKRRYSDGERDILADNNINPIRFAPGRGIVNWGQRTLLARPSALQGMNVRLMLIVVEPAVKTALEDFIFELNTVATRTTVSAILNSYMTGIKSRNGVYDFSVVCDRTNNTDEDIDNHILNVWLFVKPTIDIEYIPCTVVITRTGTSFSSAALAL